MFKRIGLVLMVVIVFLTSTNIGLAIQLPHIHNWTATPIDGNEEEHLLTCTGRGECTEEPKNEGHKSFDYIANENNETHMKVCGKCGYEMGEEAHSFVNIFKNADVHTVKCLKCGYAYEEEHTMEWKEVELKFYNLKTKKWDVAVGHHEVCNKCLYGTFSKLCHGELEWASDEEGNYYQRCVEDGCGYETEYSSVEVNVAGKPANRTGNTFKYQSLPARTESALIKFIADDIFDKVEIIGLDEMTPADGGYQCEVENLDKGVNSFEIVAYIGDFSISYNLDIYVKKIITSGFSAPALAAQELNIVSTDIGSAAMLTETNSGVITITEKYAEEIIEKADGLANFTANTIAAEKVTSIKFEAELLKKLSEKGITEIGVDTAAASMRIKVSEILNKGDITIAVSEATDLSSAQKAVANGAKLYTVVITSSKSGKLTSFTKNVEITLPYDLDEDENPYTITMFSVNKDGELNNLKGTYEDETVYCLTKGIEFPVMAIANVVSFNSSEETGWTNRYMTEMLSKGILLGTDASSYLTITELNTLVKDVLDSEKDTVDSNENVSREGAAVIIKNLMPEDATIKIKAYDDFTDTDQISEYAIEAVDFVAGARIMLGYKDGSFKPQNNLRNAEVAVMAYRVFNIVNEF